MRFGAVVGRRLGEALLHVLLPPVCPLCRRRGPDAGLILCESCRGLLPPLEEPFCPRCSLPYPGVGPSHPCRRCRTDPPPFERVRVWGRYEGALLEAVRACKFEGRLELRGLLQILACRAFERHGSGLSEALTAVIPVPCDPTALRRRGFDLPALLSREVARSVSRPWRPMALRKRAATPDLVGLGVRERARAVADAYLPGEALSGTVLLVDDVVTSTATVRACARACREAGAAAVECLAVARTPMEPR